MTMVEPTLEMPACFFESVTRECTLSFLQIVEGNPLSVPVAVLWIILVLFLVFIGVSLGLGFLYLRFKRKLKRLNKILEKERGQRTGGLNESVLNRVGAALQDDKLFSHGWREFKETIVSELSVGGEREIYNTRQAVEFYPEEEIVDASVYPTFYRAIPGVLTSLGLLGTFVAILFGLAVVHVPEGVDAGKIEGISSFVNALSGKFLSSVIALVFAIIFTLAENICLSRAHLAYMRFCQNFDAVFPRRTAEEVLMKMNTELQQQRSAFEHFNTDLAASFTNGVKEGLGPVLERIVEGLQSMTGERDSNIGALLERLTTEFRSSMTQSAGLEFEQISSTMERAAQLISHANEQSDLTQSSFQGLIGAMEQSRSDQIEIFRQQSDAMNEMFQTMTATMNEASVNSQSAVDMSIREMIDKSRREARENNDALERTLQRYSENINQQVESICQRVESSAVNMAEAGASGSQQLLASIQQVTESLHQSVSTVVSQTGLASEKLTGELTSVLESNRSTASTLSQAQAAIESSLVVWSQGTEQMRLIVPPLQGTVSELGRTVDNLNAASEGARESQQQVREILSGASGELSRLQEMKESSESLLQEHRRVFDVVESGLAGALTAITDKIENLQAVSARGLNDQLQTFDNHLGTAVGKLGSAVEQLEEALDDAAERIANAGPSAS